jgi:DNA-binding NtrC family response regulator
MLDGFKTILIADANEEEQEYLSISLAAEGYKVETAKASSEMIQKLHNNSDVSVIVMDVNMPEVRAYELIPIVKKINRRIPIIVMSSDDSIDLARKVRQAGIFFYAMKPLNIEEIKLAVRDAFKKVIRETSLPIINQKYVIRELCSSFK